MSDEKPRWTWLAPHRENHGRWGTIRGIVSPRVGRVAILVFSHDERWWSQKPALTVDAGDGTGVFHTDVAFGFDEVSPQGREYIVVAYVGPDLPPNAVFNSLNDLPLGGFLSPPLSVGRTDAEPEPVEAVDVPMLAMGLES